MPRQPRLDAPGLLQHVMARGIERRKLFRNDKDRKSFLDRLADILEETQTQCYAWALIPNHFHLLLRTGPTPLSKVMRRLMTGYAVTFNIRHRRRGHLFQNRYKSVICEEDAYLLELIRYIHLNPLRANLVKDLKELDNYLWTGHSAILGRRKNPLLPEVRSQKSGMRHQRTSNKPGKPDSVKGSTPSPSSDLPASPEGKQWRAGGGFLPRENFTDVKRRSLFHWGSFSLSSGKGKKQQDPDHPVNPVKKKALAEKTVEDVLLHFGKKLRESRRRYRQFVKNGIEQGKRPEFQGGGLVRSAGGNKTGLLGRKKEEREKGDERILGSGDFITEMLKTAGKSFETRSVEKLSLDEVIEVVAKHIGLTVEDLKSTSRKRKVVHGRSIVAYVAVRNHGYKGSELADVLSLSRPTISSYLEKGKIFLDNNKVLKSELSIT